MAKTIDDWYPRDGATERLMYGNIEEKIDGYAAKYPFLTAELLAKVHAMCGTFIEAYDKIEYNRATGRQATSWFNNNRGEQAGQQARVCAAGFYADSFASWERLRGSRSFAASFAGF